jgi:hypothetical protein
MVVFLSETLLTHTSTKLLVSVVKKPAIVCTFSKEKMLFLTVCLTSHDNSL